uniref:Uncharacterized protein n=1 Tax=Trypanosoma congolense (strain IL3000) TaxID=1068625 RepID=G0UKH3_TRYCI|nr:conserved hypothetical protein [Trypanosoma congolense IL3000]
MTEAEDNFVFVSPKLRALVHVIRTTDRRDFPKLYLPDENQPCREELQRLAVEITGSPLSAEELQHFSYLFMVAEYRLPNHSHNHNPNPSPEKKPDSLMGAALVLAGRLEAACGDANISLLSVFPCVSAACRFFLDIADFKFSVRFVTVFYRLSDVICSLLQRAVVEVSKFSKIKFESRLPPVGMSQTGRDPVETLEVMEYQNLAIWERLNSDIPNRMLDVLTDIDGDIDEHVKHLKWYVEVCRETIYIDTSNFTDDISLRRLWNTYVGKGIPACLVEVFMPALKLFPTWLRKPALDVINYKDCGVVSFYSLKRLLDIWGPFMLLDRSMKQDLDMGIFNFERSLEYQCKMFYRREGAKVGDYVLTFSKAPGEILGLVLVERSSIAGQKCLGHIHKARYPLIARKIRFVQTSGAWVPERLTLEEFSSIGAACRAFPDVFCRPCGTLYETECGPIAPPLLSKNRNDEVTYSAFSLHRACFQNNVNYVRTLLSRGAAVIVNVAVVDPVVTSRYCWTPLLCAVNNPNCDPGEVVQMLLSEGADARICDDAKCTALYYSIVNGYAEATRLLLEHFPDLRPSPWTESLLVALGAHHFHARESDVRRLAELIPSGAMMGVLLPRQMNHSLVQLCVDIIEGKLCGEERLQRPGDDVSLWLPDGEAEPRTAEEEAYLSRIIAHHGVLCRDGGCEVSAAAQMLYHHCYVLSCRAHFGLLEEEARWS